MSKLVDLAPKTAVRLRDGVSAAVPIEQVVVGDVLVVKAGETVPVDGTVIEGAGVVDESAITGESVPVGKNPGDAVTGATVNTGGWFTMRADRIGADTTLAGIIRLVDEATSTKAPIERMADKIAGIFVPVVIGIAVAVFVLWMLLGAGFGTALNFAICVLSSRARAPWAWPLRLRSWWEPAAVRQTAFLSSRPRHWSRRSRCVRSSWIRPVQSRRACHASPMC